MAGELVNVGSGKKNGVVGEQRVIFFIIINFVLGKGGGSCGWIMDAWEKVKFHCRVQVLYAAAEA